MTSETQAFWDQMHGTRDRSRHRAPHPRLASALGPVTPGRALELGCGDGVSAVWLASRGWAVTAVDVSAVALEAAAERASHAGVADRITWEHGDLTDWTTDETFDLIMAFFLHTPLELNGAAVLRRFAGQTRKGGTLLSVGHYTLPPWAWDPSDTEGLLSGAQLAAAVGIDEPEWTTVVADELPRAVTDHDGNESSVLDAVLHARKTGSVHDQCDSF